MAPELIIGVSGLRGIIGENLTPALAAEYAGTFGTFLKDEYGDDKKKLSVCIGRDSRPSGPMLASAVIAGLCSVGIDTVGLGVVSTPGVGIMVRHLGCVGGIVVTASHNPIEYNGIKLLLGDGIAPPVHLAQKIKNMFLDRRIDFAGALHCGRPTNNDETDMVHLAKVLAIVDKEAIAARNFKVVLDSVNGAGGRVGRKLLSELGCEIVAMNDEPTGVFAHTPEPLEENLQGLCRKVAEAGAQAGFAMDPDADRVAIVDEAGTYIGEEYSVALATKYVFSKNLTKKAGINISTSRMTEDIAAEAGGEVVYTAIGEANVAEGMTKNNCVIGGEGNGGVIDLRVGPVRDSLVGIALVLQLMTDTDSSISELVGQINGYSMEKVKLPATKEQADSVIAEAKKVFSDAKLNTLDGARFDFEDGWALIRSSNTEPVMRIVVETRSDDRTKHYIDTVAKIRKEILG